MAAFGFFPIIFFIFICVFPGYQLYDPAISLGIMHFMHFGCNHHSADVARFKCMSTYLIGRFGLLSISELVCTKLWKRYRYFSMY